MLDDEHEYPITSGVERYIRRWSCHDEPLCPAVELLLANLADFEDGTNDMDFGPILLRYGVYPPADPEEARALYLDLYADTVGMLAVDLQKAEG